jgi:type IV pilus assembly protein PilY1
MKDVIKIKTNTRRQSIYLALMSWLVLTLPLPVKAATVTLATEPLATSTTSAVKPNIMFILDDSGSMGWNYLPDWANDSDPITGNGYSSEIYLYKNSGFNGVAYNPAVSYVKPVMYNTDGTLNTATYPDMLSPWTAVKIDGYGIESTGTANLVGAAEHYVFEFAEYCTSVKMNKCTASAVPIVIGADNYNILAKLRWCDSAALTNCQNINNATFKYPRYPGPLAARATLKVTAGGTATSITVNGFQILSAATTT